MKKIFLVSRVTLVLVSVIIFCSCSNQETYKQNKTPNNNNDEHLSGTLTVSTYFDAAIMKYSQEFMQLHPNVKIEMKIPDRGELEYESLEQYGQRTAIEIMSGNGADVIDLSHFSSYRYASSDLLCNLYDFMDNDPDFQKADYYTNIFSAKEVGGSLYTIPFYFMYDMMVVSRPLTENMPFDYDELDYKSMLSIYETILSLKSNKEPLILPGIIKEYFYSYEIPAFYDISTGEAWIDSSEFVEYLEETKSIITPYDPVHMEWKKTRIAEGNDDFMRSEYVFCALDVTAIDVYNLLVDYNNISAPIPIVSSGGDAMFKTMKAEYGIPTYSNNKKLAWEFLKFCVEEKIPPDSSDREKAQEYVMNYHTWVPININNFRHAFRLQCEMDIDMLGDSVKWKSNNPKDKIEELLDLVHEWNLRRNRAMSETEIWFLINEDLENYYYYDLATAEETAMLIQSKVAAYLGEQK